MTATIFRMLSAPSISKHIFHSLKHTIEHDSAIVCSNEEICVV